jgi:hypothetical protein
MKQIKKRDRRVSWKFKVITSVVLILLVLAFVFTIPPIKNTKDVPDLTYSAQVSAPACAPDGGFYSNAFALKLIATTPGTLVYYTLDGTEPTLASALYTHPLVIAMENASNHLSVIPTSPRWKPPIGDVFRGTVLRAIAVDNKKLKSAELVRTFFIDEKSAKRYSFPVVVLTVNEKDFFGYKKGIYVLGKSYGDKDNYIRKNISLDLPWWEYPSNYLMRGEDAERSAHIGFYEPDGKLGFESAVGVRINGNATRGYAQKSLRICFNKKYGQAVLNYNLFPGQDVKNFNSFILRNSGNDWDKTMFRDGLMQSLMKNTHLDIQADRPSVVFINGEYWGIHNIRERFDENYLANKYHVSIDSITILELGGNLSYGKKGDEKEFKELLNFVKLNDVSKIQNYEYLKTKIDIESFSDFLIANIYYCNSDWPNNNVKFWRYKTWKPADSISAKDGRWRWMLYDTDWGFGYNTLSTPDNNLLEKARKTGSVGILFNTLIKNKDFVLQFTKRFQELLNTNFNTQKVIAQIDSMEKIMAPEMQEHIDRWRIIGSYSKWLSNVDVMKEYATKRPKIQAEQLNTFFNLKGSQMISINEN